MDNQYLIPANSKKSMLLLGLFEWLDLYILGGGVGITMLLIFLIPMNNLTLTAVALAPGLICSFLVMPFPNYHNVRVLIKEMLTYALERKNYIWKGWCSRDEFK